MSFTDISNQLKELGKNLDAKMPGLIATAALVEFEAAWKERIFDKGLKSDGSKIGNYSTTPAYFNKNTFIRKSAFKPRGKNGGETKTMFLPGGYSEFRDIQGRETDHINLKFSGSEERAFRIYKFGSEVIFGNADDFEHKKIEGQEDDFGAIFEPSKEEEDLLNSLITEQSILVANGQK